MAAWFPFAQIGMVTGGKEIFWLGVHVLQERRAVDGAGFVLF